MRLPLLLRGRVHSQLAVDERSPAAAAEVLRIGQRVLLLFVGRLVVVLEEDGDVLDLLLAGREDGGSGALVDEDRVADEEGHVLASRVRSFLVDDACEKNNETVTERVVSCN